MELFTTVTVNALSQFAKIHLAKEMIKSSKKLKMLEKSCHETALDVTKNVQKRTDYILVLFLTGCTFFTLYKKVKLKLFENYDLKTTFFSA
jgi:hypothetical protein